MTTLELQNAVFIQNDQIKTDSLKVADVFGKRHSDIIRAIKNIDCSTEFSERNFASADYLDEQRKSRPMYEMTKDGFIFLAMGFTGAKAAQIKEAYIKAFNQMADMLLKQQNQLQTIQVGSVVQLRSGSPNLTVNNIFDDVAEVIWFKGGRIIREHLPVSCLSLGESDRIAPSFVSLLEAFWSNLYAHGIHNFNHSNRTDQIAVNLTQVLDLFPELFKRSELIQTLQHSKAPYPEYVEHNIVIQSRLERKTIRCWVFKSNQPTMIDVGR
ncbi:Rha family transcriptional regulator [Acinetobacter lactucae]|uniref:Rha family transcriptional regulator n=1 Tax=Acinetobacter lactucae TaxID=1785128 RepID=UPI0007074FD8|nr:Rha family transcriptional regulator [Acinetobacter lactucae]KQE92139.1 Rha family transcriptional regulator [Acinetobacter lactucae]